MIRRVSIIFFVFATLLASLDYFEIHKSIYSDTYHEWNYQLNQRERAERIFRLIVINPIKQVVNSFPQSPKNVQDTLEFYIEEKKLNEFISIQEQLKYVAYLKSGVKYRHQIPAYFIDDNGDTSRVKLRSVGMMSDHYSPKETYGYRTEVGSFKVKFGKHSNPFGRKAQKSILLRNTRNDGLDILANSLLAQVVDSANIIVESKPIGIKINGVSNFTAYLLEDGFDKYLIEKNRKREGSLFKMGWKGPIRASQDILNHGELRFLDVDYMANDSSFVSRIASQFNEGNFEEIPFDEDLLDRVMILCLDLFGGHPLLDNNLHWYHNPVTNKIEPTLRECMDSVAAHFNDERYRDQFYQYWLEKNVSRIEEIRRNSYSRIDIDLLLEELSEKIDTNKFGEILNKIKKLTTKYSRLEEVGEVEVKEYVLSNNIILDSTLRVSESEKLVFKGGLNLQMRSNAKIIIEGGSLVSTNSEEGTIVNGGSILVMRGNVDLSNVSFKNMTALIDSSDYHFLPSAFTAYECDVSLIGCIFDSNLAGDDFLNLFRSTFVLKECRFKNIKADAFDSDFSRGLVKASSFSMVGNDAIDASGSDIEISDCTFNYVQDKAISAGEFSSITVDQSKIVSSEIGLCSKDGSVLSFKNLTFDNNKLDATAYRKKLEYPGHSLLYTGSESLKISFLYDYETVTNIDGIMDEKLLEKMYGVTYGKSSR